MNRTKHDRNQMNRTKVRKDANEPITIVEQSGVQALKNPNPFEGF